MPTYWRGDTIRLKLEVEHDFNIGDAWAVFLQREESEGASRFPLALELSEIEEVRRVDSVMTSTVLFEITVSRKNSLPGEYDLDTVRGLPVGVERQQGLQGVPFEAIRAVSLRIAEETDEPTGKVTFSKLERSPNSRRVY